MRHERAALGVSSVPLPTALSDETTQLGRELDDDELIEADALSVGFAFKGRVKRARKTDDKPTALRRGALD